MSKDLFEGLDSIVFEQPDIIDIKDFNKADEAPKADDTVKLDDSLVDKTDDKKEENFIDPNDFFNKVKENSEEKVVDDEDTTEEKEAPEGKPEDVLKGWADFFKDNTFLADEDLTGFDGSIEALTEAFQKREVRVGMEMVEDYKSQLPAEIKFLADNWEEGVPLNELINIKSNQLRYSKVTDEKLEESVDTQKAVYAEYLRKTTKYSESKIEKELQRLIDLDEIKDESKEALVELKKFEAEAEDILKRETKKQREARLAENAKQIKTYEKTIKDTKEIIPGLKLDEKTQEDIFNKIVNPIGINGFGEPVSYISDLRSEDPYKFDMAVTYLATITKGFTDWSKIVSAGETKAVRSLEKVLNTTPPKTTRDNVKTSGKQSLMSLLEKNKSIFTK